MGFSAVGTTSAGLAWALGREDGVGQVSREETLANAALVMSGTSLPVSADLESGFGDSPEACAHTITQAAAIGLAGGSIEDSTGTREGAVYEFAHAVKRVEAAVEAARASGFVLTARTECLREDGSNLDNVIARLVAFEAAGADVLFAPGLSAEHAAEVAGAQHKPLNVLIGFAAPAQKLERLFAAGARQVSLGERSAADGGSRGEISVGPDPGRRHHRLSCRTGLIWISTIRRCSPLPCSGLRQCSALARLSPPSPIGRSRRIGEPPI